MLTLPELETDNRHLLLRAISGSRAYGLDTPESDTDIKGVFVLPEADFYALNPIEQLNNPSNDVVYYEWRKFVALLHGSNPNILELLNTPAHALLYRHPLLEQLRPEWLLSKQCLHTFAGYAYGQIKKAHGLNKKIVNPMPQEKKTVLDFAMCYRPLLPCLWRNGCNNRAGWKHTLAWSSSIMRMMCMRCLWMKRGCMVFMALRRLSRTR